MKSFYLQAIIVLSLYLCHTTEGKTLGNARMNGENGETSSEESDSDRDGDGDGDGDGDAIDDTSDIDEDDDEQECDANTWEEDQEILEYADIEGFLIDLEKWTEFFNKESVSKLHELTRSQRSVTTSAPSGRWIPDPGQIAKLKSQYQRLGVIVLPPVPSFYIHPYPIGDIYYEFEATYPLAMQRKIQEAIQDLEQRNVRLRGLEL